MIMENSYFYVRNAQGDIIGLIDKAGTQVASYTYDSWGKLISIEGTLKDTVGVKNPYRYRGYRYDTETGLYYLQSRYYNPEWGRFINADALIGQTGELLGHNMFAYTKNNPVNMSDKNGFRPVYTMGEETDEMREASYAAMGEASKSIIMMSKKNRKPGKTPPKSWPTLPKDLAGKKPKWSPLGYWEGRSGKYTWDNRSHGAGVNRGDGEQDGHWDDEDSDNRWDRNGNQLGGSVETILSGRGNKSERMLSGIALSVYLIISEGSRILFPPRNLIPIP